MVEFPYREEKSKIFGRIKRPVAKVLLRSESSNEWKPSLMYIDSGADISLVPKDFGILLGLDLTRNQNEIRGIGEAIAPISLHDVFMKINDEEIKVKIAVALINEVPYILGRYDFFKLYKISFQEYANKIVVEKP